MDIMIELQRRLAQAGSQALLAKELNVSQPYLSNVLAGRADPGPLILDALGVERVVTYRQKASING